MEGENWYRIQLNTEHVGYMYNNAYRDHSGRWHFVSTTHFLLQDGAPNTIVKHLIFAAKAPYPLYQAIYSSRNQDQQMLTQVDKADQGYVATLVRDKQSNAVPLDWTYDLKTFVGFEHWLTTTSPEPLAEHMTRSLDFERLRITQRSYRVVEQNSQGYLVETNAPFAATQTQLNHQFQPVRLNMAGIFDVTATDEADAIALKKMRRKTNYLFSVDQRLNDHTTLSKLHLQLNKPASFNLPAKMMLTANPVTSRGDGSEHAGEELRYPITHPTIQALVQRSLASTGVGDTVIEQLVDTANAQLRYAEDEPAGSVLTALAEGRGECTDYADLFTTLARAAGFPARNVYGLAYKDGANPAFMFHAWNEVYSDGTWQAVDPTWNQTTVDATHMPLSDTQAALMMLANNTGSISFSVLETAYF